MRRPLLAIALVAAGATPSAAGVEDWRISEVFASAAGDPNIRFVELYVPPTPLADNCFYSTTVLEVLGPDGSLLGAVAPNPTDVVCFPGNTYFVFGTNEASAFFGEHKDKPLTVEIPLEGGQICLKSSSTRYDCVRWGTVTNPVTDIFGSSDTSTAPALADNTALARRMDTEVVSADFVLQAPTMRQPNDGSFWPPPDAGPPPDANNTPDAEPKPDARPWADAWFLPRPDAREGDPAWYAADPGGGPACSCRVGARGAPSGIVAIPIAILIVAIARRRRR